MKHSKKTLDLEGKSLTLETGILANQATAAVTGRMGDTMILATVVMSERDTDLDYFPLKVEYAERLSAGGKIKGSRWVKREGRPSDEGILTARLIDRSIRPLFPSEIKKDIQIIVTMLSVDGENDPDILSLITVSAALAISKIPWDGPIGASRVGFIGEEGKEKELVVNPSMTHYENSDLDLVVSSSKDRAVMIEAGANEIKESDAIEAIKKAKATNDKVIDLINDFVKDVGEKKITLPSDEAQETANMLVEKSYSDKIQKIIDEGISKETNKKLSELTEEIAEANEDSVEAKKVSDAVQKIFKKLLRKQTLKDKKRPDGRGIDELRDLSAQVDVLPRTHGSAIFSRGETQALTVATLGAPSLSQLIETPEGEETKHYMHHYNFPPYSVGETGRFGYPSRREIGHGALAERALEPVVPSETEFPYTIRVVSEIMSSNGSTSMASTCGSTLALMDAGVPITSPVAGISIGLVEDGKDYVLLTDILGIEDHTGDMDFKVAGTKNGVTAIQLDVKNTGLTEEMIEQTFEKAKTARDTILKTMLKSIPESRKDVSEFAPKIKTIQIDPSKIGEVIGSGGKVIRNISETTGAQVDVTDEGIVTVSAVEEEAVRKAIEWVDNLTREIEAGEVFTGKVTRMLDFGAFVQLVPGKEGLVHVSEMSHEYVDKPDDVVKIGQEVKVRVKEIDDQGRINLSMKFGEPPEGSGDKDKRQDHSRSVGRQGHNRRGGHQDRRGGRSSRPQQQKRYGFEERAGYGQRSGRNNRNDRNNRSSRGRR